MRTRLDPSLAFYREYRGAGRNYAIFILDSSYPSRESMRSFRGNRGWTAQAALTGRVINNYPPGFCLNKLHALSLHHMLHTCLSVQQGLCGCLQPVAKGHFVALAPGAPLLEAAEEGPAR
jgi:hypothetical protein